jgi:hypothetical protein
MIDLCPRIRCIAITILLGPALVAPSHSLSKDELAAAQTRYKQEVADCMGNPAVQDVSTCLKDAKNSLAEIKRGHMTETEQTADFERNALQRCDIHQGDDKSACVARIRGQGRTEGSVLGGGILRELETKVPVQSTP